MTIHTRENQGDPAELPAAVKASLERFMRSFEEFKTKNDQRLGQIEKRGSDDVVTREQVDKINKALDAHQDEISDLFKRANRSSIVTTGDAAAAETRANERFDAEFRSDGRSASLANAGQARGQYRSAFDTMIRKGDRALSSEQVRALSAGSAPDGGYWIEPARVDTVITRVRETSEMRQIANVVTIGSNRLEMPVDRGEFGYEWVGETNTRSETTTSQIGKLEIPVHEVSAMPKITQNLLDDAMFDVEGWVNGKIADRFARAENSAFVTGNGTSRPRGFLTGTPTTAVDASRPFGTLQYIGTGSSGAFPASNPSDKLLDLIYALTAPYRANGRFVMNRTTVGLIRKFKDGQGNYIWQPSFVLGQPQTIMGFPVSEFADMPDLAANSLSVAFGDFRAGYLIVDRQGIRQLRDPYTAKPYVTLYTTKRVGGDLQDSDAIKLLKFA